MFFTHIFQMMTEGVDLTLVVRKTADGRMAVSLLPKAPALKEHAQHHFVPLVLCGTPAELDAGFFTAAAQPVQRAAGLLVNLAEFEKQAEKASASSKASKAAAAPKDKEPKEVQQKREKYEKYTKRAEELMAAGRFEEAIFSFQQARLHATGEQMAKVDERLAAARTELSWGSLFGMYDVPPATAPQLAAQAQPAPAACPQMPPQAAAMPCPHEVYPQPPLPPMPHCEQAYPGIGSAGLSDYDNPDDLPTHRPEEYAEYVDFPQSMVSPRVQPMAQ